MPFRLAATGAEGSSPPAETPVQAPAESPDRSLPESELDAIVGTIRRAGMSGVASVLLHAFKPLSWTGGQLLWALAPLAESFTGRTGRSSALPGLARLLEHEGGVDALLARLDAAPGKDK